MNRRIQDIYRPVDQRRRDFDEVERALSFDELKGQAGRCMNCGIPFCHGAGCPLGNVIPEINAAVAAGNWEAAWNILSSTSFFPEFTSRVCPALCEGSCTDGIDGEPVMVRQLEKAVVEAAFRNGFVKPPKPQSRSGKSVAVIGGGPAGLAAATALNLAGHTVTVYEKNAAPGGLLRYGIPDFKLSKKMIDRRIALMEEAGIRFECGTEVGRDISGGYLARRHDATVLTIGTPQARDLAVPGREASGIHFALEFLQGQNRVLGRECAALPVNAAGKRVVVIGGGDTGSDCVGTSVRQGAASILQIEIMPKPPETRSPSTPWPQWPYLLRTSSSHREGGERRWNLATKRFCVEGGRVAGLEAVTVEWEFSPLGRPLTFRELPDSAEFIPADLVLLAMGFTGVAAEGVAAELGLAVDARGRVQPAPERGIFAAGDSASGASLVVRAIADGKRVAQAVDAYLKGGAQ
ncbi:glutamate synthase subunit beta [Victivallaceae bacterium BBE-744-WT-12]|uniref:Glutamate synthase subunit beta n=1 Tax=Victivallis lenta TaxID=2606640 RepID=A0A844G3X6_9BACT|nr:glutamate synthase subunit beta [Victivallis lenta]AVM46853.1 glutamate synthase subunit beta [Victivallales bacterium CCUG 44730]MST97853.1 glutamate synthase subunit beta [Victivallis lenta]HBP07349.1 glutamate synthase subunit beta [Lentisphaeria bacterium]